jgi:hypothetical protein
MKKTLEMINQSFKGSNGKIDHKRLTVFAFVILVFVISGVALYKKTPIANQAIIEYVLVTAGTIIVGGMGLTKINLKTDIKNET